MPNTLKKEREMNNFPFIRIKTEQILSKATSTAIKKKDKVLMAGL